MSDSVDASFVEPEVWEQYRLDIPDELILQFGEPESLEETPQTSEGNNNTMPEVQVILPMSPVVPTPPWLKTATPSEAIPPAFRPQAAGLVRTPEIDDVMSSLSTATSSTTDVRVAHHIAQILWKSFARIAEEMVPAIGPLFEEPNEGQIEQWWTPLADGSDTIVPLKLGQNAALMKGLLSDYGVALDEDEATRWLVELLSNYYCSAADLQIGLATPRYNPYSEMHTCRSYFRGWAANEIMVAGIVTSLHETDFGIVTTLEDETGTVYVHQQADAVAHGGATSYERAHSAEANGLGTASTSHFYGDPRASEYEDLVGDLQG
ncbi:uncharacterized protein BXZ73DRAFT_107654 [Epithele typhae]|uniref:uncharacterized protein n=1 Tax=Epithele typhae TaxID=378194 RepID=UPI0020079AD4|nr:uncharacterized protein BXZ73DRAFT_107654 [Epithele typhae]KAH9912108.1 hypothetical protein BXZ73DRAFT_107654 [Epithele typhae]